MRRRLDGPTAPLTSRFMREIRNRVCGIAARGGGYPVRLPAEGLGLTAIVSRLRPVIPIARYLAVIQAAKGGRTGPESQTKQRATTAVGPKSVSYKTLKGRGGPACAIFAPALSISMRPREGRKEGPYGGEVKAIVLAHAAPPPRLLLARLVFICSFIVVLEAAICRPEAQRP